MNDLDPVVDVANSHFISTSVNTILKEQPLVKQGQWPFD